MRAFFDLADQALDRIGSAYVVTLIVMVLAMLIARELWAKRQRKVGR